MTRTAGQISMSVPNKNQPVIALLDYICSTHPDISTHILIIKLDTDRLGSEFELAASHLFKADPVERSKSKLKKCIVISSTLRGSKTYVEFCWYHPKEFE